MFALRVEGGVLTLARELRDELMLGQGEFRDIPALGPFSLPFVNAPFAPVMAPNCRSVGVGLASGVLRGECSMAVKSDCSERCFCRSRLGNHGSVILSALAAPNSSGFFRLFDTRSLA